jgi:hypothetical protein
MVYFNLSGNIPEFRIALQIYIRGNIMYGALSFSIRVEISSYPPVFLDFKDLIIFSIRDNYPTDIQKWISLPNITGTLSCNCTKN